MARYAVYNELGRLFLFLNPPEGVNIPIIPEVYKGGDDAQLFFTKSFTMFFLKRAKKLLPYIDIGEANKMMASAKKQKKEGGKKPPPGKGKRKSAYKLRQVLSAGEDPVLPFLPNLMHEDRR
jgi:hypothetical protein